MIISNVPAVNIFSIAGRGTSTHAYTHSVSDSHHVFLNLHTLKFYCLPDNYEIIGMVYLYSVCALYVLNEAIKFSFLKGNTSNCFSNCVSRFITG